MATNTELHQPRTTWNNRIVGRGEVSPEELVPHPGNWRRHPEHQLSALAGVLDQVGWVQQVVVNRRTGRMVDGHLRVELARRRQEPIVPVLYVDLDDAEEALVLATLDPLAALATPDPAALQALLERVDVENDAVRSLLAAIEQDANTHSIPRRLGDPDDTPPLPRSPISATGDRWLLGGHVLLVGDATRAADVDRLMAGEQARWMWTDPPYGVEYQGGTRHRLRIQNDHAAQVPDLLQQAFANADEALVPGAPLYVAHPAGPLGLAFGEAILAAGWHLHQTLVWLKDAFALGHSDYHYQHEPIAYGWKSGGRRSWFGGRSQASVFEIPRPRRAEEHPTQKPVALIAAMLANSSTAGDVGIDLFAGSGSTVIAAEQLGRRCFAIEIDPRYADAALHRWEAFTGVAAIHEDTGLPMQALGEVRDGR